MKCASFHTKRQEVERKKRKKKEQEKSRNKGEKKMIINQIPRNAKEDS